MHSHSENPLTCTVVIQAKRREFFEKNRLYVESQGKLFTLVDLHYTETLFRYNNGKYRIYTLALSVSKQYRFTSTLTDNKAPIEGDINWFYHNLVAKNRNPVDDDARMKKNCERKIHPLV